VRLAAMFVIRAACRCLRLRLAAYGCGVPLGISAQEMTPYVCGFLLLTFAAFRRFASTVSMADAVAEVQMGDIAPTGFCFHAYCPCTSNTKNSTITPVPETCKAGNAHLQGHFLQAKAATRKIKTHLMYSPYHQLKEEEANEEIEQALKDGHVMLCEWEYEVDGPSSVPPTMPRPKDGSAPKGQGKGVGVMQTINSLMNDVRQLQEETRQPIGSRRGGQQGAVGAVAVADRRPDVNIRQSEMVVIVDSIDRAARAARNAERLSSAAAATFNAEASALEQAKNYLQEMIRR
jgi:hypothetical protein